MPRKKRKPHSYEAEVIRQLEDKFGRDVANEFKKCINHAQFWDRNEELKQGTGDAFTNVLENTGCNTKLMAIPDAELRNRAEICLKHYK